jgi:DNA-binding MarR family transcriptional regulator
MPTKMSTRRAQTLAEEMQANCLGVRVGRLHRIVARRFDQALRPLGLSLSQMEILSGLTIMGRPARPAYIADKLGVERSTMSRNLALMEAKDLIATVETSPKGRSMTVTITDHGTSTLAHATAAWRAAQADLIDHLGPQAPSILDAWVAGVDPPANSDLRRPQV